MKIRSSLMGLGLGAAFAVLSAVPAQAEPHSPAALPAFSTFAGESTNKATRGSVEYRYWSDGNGWYTAEYRKPTSSDQWPGDGWGGRVLMHFDSVWGSDRNIIVDNQDSQSRTGMPDKFSGVANIWFEVCNFNFFTGEQYSCQRLHKT
ncbi:hypothetical protein ACFH04_02190 [Streptomyces noboritoensis]|uniref:Uncharacterized protein n=1 Tax=Streptomyces noboritoensis TaxID=67337 RepID=A0ABV6T9T4_9ACTN